jgi:hypothetical protein
MAGWLRFRVKLGRIMKKAARSFVVKVATGPTRTIISPLLRFSAYGLNAKPSDLQL